MEPNNSQQTNTPQMQQPVPQALPIQMVQPQIPKKGNGKRIILLILILLLLIEVGVYILSVKNQSDNTKEASTDYDINTVLPTPTYAAPSPSVSESTSRDDLNVESPEADLQLLDNDVSGL